MKGKMTQKLYILLYILGVSSCIYDDLSLCPPLCIEIDVEDKNYHNIYSAVRLGFEEKKDENLPFREYISTMTYNLHHVESGREVLLRYVEPVEGDDKTFRLPVPRDLPLGKYVVTAWGNVSDTTVFDDNLKGIDLHPDNRPGEDVYLTHDTINYTPRDHHFTLAMERTKGKLIIQVEGMPDAYRASSKTVTDISGYTCHHFNYDQPIDLSVDTVWPAPRSMRTKTVLAPSIERDRSVLSISFFEGEQIRRDASILMPEDVNLTLRGNELTILRYIYDRSCCCFKVYILVNDNWEILHSMEII